MADFPGFGLGPIGTVYAFVRAFRDREGPFTPVDPSYGPASNYGGAPLTPEQALASGIFDAQPAQEPPPRVVEELPPPDTAPPPPPVVIAPPRAIEGVGEPLPHAPPGAAEQGLVGIDRIEAPYSADDPRTWEPDDWEDYALPPWIFPEIYGPGFAPDAGPLYPHERVVPPPGATRFHFVDTGGPYDRLERMGVPDPFTPGPRPTPRPWRLPRLPRWPTRRRRRETLPEPFRWPMVPPRPFRWPDEVFPETQPIPLPQPRAERVDRPERLTLPQPSGPTLPPRLPPAETPWPMPSPDAFPTPTPGPQAQPAPVYPPVPRGAPWPRPASSPRTRRATQPQPWPFVLPFVLPSLVPQPWPATQPFAQPFAQPAPTPAPTPTPAPAPDPLTGLNADPLPFARLNPEANQDEDRCRCDDELEPNPSNVIASVRGFARRMSQNSLDNLRRGFS